MDHRQRINSPLKPMLSDKQSEKSDNLAKFLQEQRFKRERTSAGRIGKEISIADLLKKWRSKGA